MPLLVTSDYVALGSFHRKTNADGKMAPKLENARGHLEGRELKDSGCLSVGLSHHFQEINGSAWCCVVAPSFSYHPICGVSAQEGICFPVHRMQQLNVPLHEQNIPGVCF